MASTTLRPVEARAHRLHAVRLSGTPLGGNRGTILGPLPLWFDHQGVTYVRTPQRTPDAGGTVIHLYRAVDTTTTEPTPDPSPRASSW
jgi:hypothetical protein